MHSDVPRMQSSSSISDWRSSSPIPKPSAGDREDGDGHGEVAVHAGDDVGVRCLLEAAKADVAECLASELRAVAGVVPADGRGSLLALADGGGRGPGVALAARAVRVFDGAVRIGGPATIPGAGGVSETREPRPAYGPQTSVL